jgi:hypothetical protein
LDPTEWRECANSGHSPTAWPTGKIDPVLPFKIGHVDRRKAEESGISYQQCVDIRF